MQITKFKNTNIAQGCSSSLNFEDLYNFIAEPENHETKSSMPLFNLCSFKKDYHHGKHFEYATGIVIDIDNKHGDYITFEQSNKLLLEKGVKFISYTSPSSHKDLNKYRIILPLTTKIDVNTYRKYVGQMYYIYGDAMDTGASFDHTHMYFYGKLKNSTEYKVFKNEGMTLDYIDDGEFFDQETLPVKYKTESSNTILDQDDFTLCASNPSEEQINELKIAMLEIYNHDASLFDNNEEWINWAYRFRTVLDPELGFDLFKFASRLTKDEKYKEGGDGYLTDEQLREHFDKRNPTSVSVHWLKTFKIYNDIKKAELNKVADDFFIRASDFEGKLKPTQFLIKHIIQEGALQAIIGKSGHGKSFIAVEQAFCIAAGISYCGKAVKQSSVLYVCGEGFTGIVKRIKALEVKYNIKCPRGLILTRYGIDFHDKDKIDKFNIALSKIIDHDEKIGLIVLDTFNACYHGDENSSQHVGEFIDNVSSKYRSKGIAVLVIHHTGLADKGRGRGSTALYAGLDIEIIVEKEDKTIELSWSKAKDFEKPEDIMTFKFNVIELDCFEEGTEEEDTRVPYLVYAGMKVKLAPDQEALEIIDLVKDHSFFDETDLPNGWVAPVEMAATKDVMNDYIAVGINSIKDSLIKLVYGEKKVKDISEESLGKTILTRLEKYKKLNLIDLYNESGKVTRTNIFKSVIIVT